MADVKINLNNAKARHANENQYGRGNDREIPESAWVASSYIDGIHTQFASTHAAGWPTIQDTFKLNQRANAWYDGLLEGVTEEAASGFNGSAVFLSAYNTNKTMIATEAWPKYEESGRGEYVNEAPSATPGP